MKKQSIRCKPGDRARVVRSLFPENIGKIVVVVRPYDGIEQLGKANSHVNVEESVPSWVVVPVWNPIKTETRGVTYFEAVSAYEDFALQPLRDDEGGIEGLTVRTKPMSIVGGAH